MTTLTFPEVTVTAVRMEPGNGPRRWWFGNSANGRLHAQLMGPYGTDADWEVYAEERGGVGVGERGHMRCASQSEALDVLERVFETRVILPLHWTEKP